MNDRELLELAAKAMDAGIVFYGECWRSQNGHEWSPLTDDGEALRLAVRLRISVDPGDSKIFIHYPHHIVEPLGSDPMVTVRRAIVRAAAAIGEAMP